MQLLSLSQYSKGSGVFRGLSCLQAPDRCQLVLSACRGLECRPQAGLLVSLLSLVGQNRNGNPPICEQSTSLFFSVFHLLKARYDDDDDDLVCLKKASSWEGSRGRRCLSRCLVVPLRAINASKVAVVCKGVRQASGRG